jgi:hypothetical protein
MCQLADEKLEASMARLEDIRFVNVAIDSGTVHSFTLIHCIISNPIILTRPALFDLCESLHFTTENYASLFESIVRRLMPRESSTSSPERKKPNIVICVFLIDHLKAQADALDLFLVNTREYSVIIHIHCFAHMLNLVMCRSPDGDSLSRVVGEIKALQLLLRKHEAVSFIGTKCPAFVATHWLD